MSLVSPNDPDAYAPDHRLSKAYDEATLLNDEGLEALCPAYIELAEVDTRYRDGEALGQGSVKDVYRTYDNRTKRWVAMARLRQDRGPDFYDLFVHEAWLTSSLSHPNIIKVHDAGVDSVGRPYFTMDLKGNTSLADLAKVPQAKNRRHVLEVFTKICDAVSYAHSRGVIHLDLKPENIQADAFGEVLVCDWGIGKVIGEMEEGESDIPVMLRPLDNMTLIGQIKGTPGYMAPEQVISKVPKDHRTDVFALGCILHFILTGDSPFTGSVEKILDDTTRANVIPPRMRYPHLEIPESLQAVVMKATARDPDNRYQTVLALQEEIHSYLGGYSTEAEQSSFFREALLFVARNRVPAVITSLALVVLTVLSVLFVQRLNRQTNATAEQEDRATLFASEAGEMKSQYNSLVEEFGQSSEELALKLAKSANSHKNLGVFKKPVEAVAEAQELARMALALDPDCNNALIERFSLHCLTLNFREALAAPPKGGYKFADYIEFARAFPEFEFTGQIRPSPDQLIAFFRGAREINPERGPLMERILSYDFATRRNRTYKDRIVAALVEYVNGGKDGLSIDYSFDDFSCVLTSNRDTRLLVPFGSESCLLSHLHVRSLKLAIAGGFNLADLQNLPLESLDLSECDAVLLREAVSLPFLREIRVRPGQFELGRLRRLVLTGEQLNIIKEAPSS